MKIGDRIGALIKYKNLNYRSLGVLIEYSDVQVRKVVLNKSSPNIEFIQAIIRNFKEVNLQWLLTGEGAMLHKNSYTLEDFSASEIIDYILVHRAFFEKEIKINILIDVFSTIAQRNKLEETNKQVEKLQKLIEKNMELLQKNNQ